MLFVFDVDGTLCFDGVTIAPSITDVLSGIIINNHQLAFASARPIRDLLPVIHPSSPDVLLIGGNGSIVRKDNSISVIAPIPRKPYEDIIRIINQYQLDFIIDDTFNYSAKIPEYNPIKDQLDPKNLAANVTIAAIQKPIKIIIVNIDPLVFNQVLEELKVHDSELALITHMKENSIDITAKGINKYTTLRKITPSPYIAFGNDSNDVELLNNAESRYFVGDNRTGKSLGIHEFHSLNKDPEMIAKTISLLIEPE